ncbi:MAG: hypothetical protein K8R85_04595, partial [Bacteroidetes bacterium]|nr:hypothetical protein [Bacteroidota bacterium]
MKNNIIITFFVLFFSAVCFANKEDSTSVKKSFHTIEACIGISPKAHRKYVVSSKGYIIYGLWYDYSRKIKNNFHVAFVLNPLAGSDDFSMRDDNANGFDIQK